MRIRNHRLKTERGELLTREHPAAPTWILLQTARNQANYTLRRQPYGQRGYRK